MSRRPLSASSSACPRVPAPSSSSPPSSVLQTPRLTQQPTLPKHSRAACVAPSPSFSSSSSSSPSAFFSAPSRTSASPRPGGAPGAPPPSLKLVWARDGELQETALAAGSVLSIGRAKSCAVCLRHDGQVSNLHASISDGLMLSDCGSTNGTTVNEQPVVRPHRLRLNDVIRCGNTELRIEAASASGRSQKEKEQQPPHGEQESLRSKHFPSPSPAAAEPSSSPPSPSPSSADTVESVMEAEFSRVIGHEGIKSQLRQFYKKVQLDRIRQAAGREADGGRLYHMIFSGPPGTGKTTMANVVSKLLLAMQLVRTSSVVFVNNSLELLGSYVGQTPQKVDAKVAEAAGGVLFIDEAYSIVKEGGGRDGSGASFGKEAIDTLMKHLDPPSCVIIFAGYEQQMEDFLTVNPGLARRIPYRYHFHAYDAQQLQQIFTVMAQAKGETLADGVLQEFPTLLSQVDASWLENQNAGLISNWLSFAQMERDDRLDIRQAEENPELASTLQVLDLQKAMRALHSMNAKR